MDLLESGQASRRPCRRVAARPGDRPRLIARYAHALGLVGRPDEARKLLQVMETHEGERFVSPMLSLTFMPVWENATGHFAARTDISARGGARSLGN